MMRMKRDSVRRGGRRQRYLLIALLIGSVLVPGKASFAQSELLYALPLLALLRGSGKPRAGIGIGAHYHTDLGALEDAESEDVESEDTESKDKYLSYIIGLKFRPNSSWAIDTAVEYHPSEREVSYIFAPRVSLLFGQGFYLGAGVERRYVKLKSGESDWNDETCLVQAGFEIPLGRDNALNIDAYYGLEEWSDVSDIISDYDSDRLTYGLRFYHYF